MHHPHPRVTSAAVALCMAVYVRKGRAVEEYLAAVSPACMALLRGGFEELDARLARHGRLREELGGRVDGRASGADGHEATRHRPLYAEGAVDETWS